MRQTRVLGTMAVTLDTLRSAVNLRFTQGGENVRVCGTSDADSLESPAVAAPLAAGLLWIFLEGRAFAHTQADEVYACLRVPGPNGVKPGSMLRDPLMMMYEELIARLPDFNGDAGVLVPRRRIPDRGAVHLRRISAE